MAEFIDKETSDKAVEGTSDHTDKPIVSGETTADKAAEGTSDHTDKPIVSGETTADKVTESTDKEPGKSSAAAEYHSNKPVETEDKTQESASEKTETPDVENKKASAEPEGKLKASIDIPGYTILTKIDEKSIYTVWKARQESLHRTVAIRILKPKYASNKQAIERFIVETRAIAKLKAQNIIQIYDFGQHNDIPFSVLEFISGNPLGKLLEDAKPLPVKEVATIAVAIAEALGEALTKADIFHCYINPDNILIGSDGEIKISNLGLAGIIRANAATTRARADIETDPCYMSPELLDNIPDLDFRTDMYSLGALMYHMLTGKKPFAGKSTAEVISAQKFGQLPYPCDLNSKIKPGFAQLIMRLMMKEPRYRFKDWESIRHELMKLQEGKIVVTKIAANAVSTIAKPGVIAPAPTRVPRKPALEPQRDNTVDKNKRLKELKKKYAKPQAPLWLKIPFELAMAVWFAWLAYQLLWLPLYPPGQNGTDQTAPGAIEDSSPGNSHSTATTPSYTDSRATTDSYKTGPAAEKAENNPEDRHTGDYAVSGRRTETPSAVNSLDTLTDKPDSVSDTPAAPPLDDIKRDIVKTLLKKNDKNAALELLRKSYPEDSSPDASKLQKFLLSGRLCEEAVAAAFERSIGITKPLMIKGRRRNISITGVKGSEISADLITGSGSSKVVRPVTFRICEIDPMEQSRWLGDAQHADTALTKFLLYMAACDYVKALKIADKCGPLAKACKDEANAKIKMLMME